MAFDASLLQYLEDDEWRLLTSIEMGMRNHELVATELIQSISGIKGTAFHYLSNLCRHRLISHEGKPYDSYQLTKNGYDFLALHTLVKRGTISHLGGILGQGKEADVYTAFAEDETPLVVKFHRIGRVSFRKAKDTRDYLSKKHSSSWLYMSRLSAQREYQNMCALQDFPTPRAIDWNRHCVVMSLVPGTLLNNISEMEDPSRVFENCIDLAVRLLKIGVVHADFSQFNLIIDDDEKVTLIDFPQCLKHTMPEAEEKFDHDLNELRRFFDLRFDLKVESIPKFQDFLDQIVPRDMSGKSKQNEEEDNGEEEDNADAKVQDKVSRENRYRMKPRRKKESKTRSRLIKEAKTYQ
ncbi:RIO family atypical protein kinase [Tritrichomonas foetus]|uniref:non-specific serine/threonine protein kinase n=1 Tax=Tritrichomonas foetus TaxID=1144522 RepID=A0A1J4K4C3_9EUKA|nr:RIO family atypical protein kinase [Tritrichomonas foetus]|eukprot:OHT04349.1 RIO family atypical protein kinase [Tritrichomonas foetus]